MKLLRRTLIAAAALVALGAQASATVGQPAPDFTLKDVTGKTVHLSDFKGKHAVLEWTNPGCPFVRKHYDSGNMPATQKDATGKGVVWLAVNSTEGEQRLPGARQACGLADRAQSHTHRRADGRRRHREQKLRRSHHAAHVHRQPAGRAGVCGWHRQHPLGPVGRHP